MAYEDRRPEFNLSGTLKNGITALATAVSSDAFTDLPTNYSNSIYLPLVIADDAAGEAEIVYVVGHVAASNTVTVVRGREGTTQRSWNAGAVVRCTPTILDVQRRFAHAGQIGSFAALNPSGVTLPISLHDNLGGFSVVSNQLNIPVAGRWRITARWYISGQAGYAATGTVTRDGLVDLTLPAALFYKGTTDDYSAVSTMTKRLAANDKLSLLATASLGSAYGSDGYNGSYLEAELVAAEGY